MRTPPLDMPIFIPATDDLSSSLAVSCFTSRGALNPKALQQLQAVLQLTPPVSSNDVITAYLYRRIDPRDSRSNNAPVEYIVYFNSHNKIIAFAFTQTGCVTKKPIQISIAPTGRNLILYLETDNGVKSPTPDDYNYSSFLSREKISACVAQIEADFQRMLRRLKNNEITVLEERLPATSSAPRANTEKKNTTKAASSPPPLPSQKSIQRIVVNKISDTVLQTQKSTISEADSLQKEINRFLTSTEKNELATCQQITKYLDRLKNCTESLKSIKKNNSTGDLYAEKLTLSPALHTLTQILKNKLACIEKQLVGSSPQAVSEPETVVATAATASTNFDSTPVKPLEKYAQDDTFNYRACTYHLERDQSATGKRLLSFLFTPPKNTQPTCVRNPQGEIFSLRIGFHK